MIQGIAVSLFFLSSSFFLFFSFLSFFLFFIFILFLNSLVKLWMAGSLAM